MAMAARDADFGQRLSFRLAALRRAGFIVGPSEQLEITSVAANMLAQGTVRDFAEFESYLAPLICKSTDQYAIFWGSAESRPVAGKEIASAPKGRTEEVEERRVPTLKRDWRRDPRLWALGAVALFGLLVLFRLIPTLTSEPVSTSGPEVVEPGRASDGADAGSGGSVREQSSTARSVQRIVDVAAAFGHVPTIAEIARGLARESGLRPEEFARALSEMTGAAVTDPVDLYGIATDAAWLPRLAQAIERLERPGREKAVAAYTPRPDPPRELVDAVDRLRSPTGSSEPDASTAGKNDGRDERLKQLLGMPVERSEPQVAIRHGLPLDWVWSLSALPFLAAFFVLAIRYRDRRAELTQRLPRADPLLSNYVTHALTNAGRWNIDQVRKIATALQRRDTVEIPVIDPKASIDATLAAGGRIFELRNQILRSAPEYLVLIERLSSGDQQAEQMRSLIEPYRRSSVVHFDVYFYHDDPTWVMPERGGRPRHIDSLWARHPDHRLIVLGSGRGWVQLDRNQLPRSVRSLRRWSRIAFLTPTPVRDWGRTEPTVARELDIAIGRATQTGFSHVPTLLGLTDRRWRNWRDWGAPDSVDVTVLETDLLLRPYRLTYDEPPDDLTPRELVAILRRELDEEGFRWLAALAVYPGLQWDMTLFLGAENRRRRSPLYTDDKAGDDRLAKLMQLPWLQAGKIPNWLRVELIGSMSLEDKGYVYMALYDLIADARRSSSETDRRMRLKIARDRSFGPNADERLEDQVFMDFMKQGADGAFKLEEGFPDQKINWQEFLADRGTVGTVLMALLLSGLAYGLLPGAATPLQTGAWLALIGFALGVVLLGVPAWRWLARQARDVSGAPDQAPVPVPRPSDRPDKQAPREEGVEPSGPPTGSIAPDIPVPEMVRIAGGRFMMGSSDEDEQARDSEKPAHLVELINYEIGRYPVTFDEYDAFCEQTGRKKPRDQGWGRGRLPVINVSWNDAQDYCAWLASVTGQNWRLPSEAEWEFACRAGTSTAYSWGDAWSQGHANGDQSKGRTTPVGSYTANPWGLFDMHGNVWEWTQDCWHDSYGNAPPDGGPWMGEDGGDCARAVLRGGSWFSDPRGLRSAIRDGDDRDLRSGTIGFRLARTLSD